MVPSRRPVVAVALLLALVGLATLPGAASATSGDPALDDGLLWGLDKIGAPAAWARGEGDGIVIAVVDSGVHLAHEDLVAKLVPGVACLDTGGDVARCSAAAGAAQDDNGHGTHVAGTAAAATHNGAGVAGTAPLARIMPVKVLRQVCDPVSTVDGCEAEGNAEDVSAGIRWAVAHGADVINLSLGSTTDAVFGPSFSAAIDAAWAAGAIPVVAAGNDYVLNSGFRDEPAIVVAATDRNDEAPSYSNGVGSAKWALSAPGGEGGDTAETCRTGAQPLGILSTYWSEGDNAAYACLSGTSMAAPHVSGAAAILRSLGLTPQQTVERLLSTAEDLGVVGADDTYGHGRIDLARAVQLSPAPPQTTTTTRRTSASPPAPTTPSSAAGGNVPGTDPSPGSGTSTPSTRTSTSTSTGTDTSAQPRLPPTDRSAAAPAAIDDDDAGGTPATVVAAAALAVLVSGGATARTLARGRLHR